MYLILVLSVSSSLDCPHSATAFWGLGLTWLQAHVEALLSPVRLKLVLNGKCLLKDYLQLEHVSFITVYNCFVGSSSRAQRWGLNYSWPEMQVSVNVLGEGMSMVFPHSPTGSQAAGPSVTFSHVIEVDTNCHLKKGVFLQGGHCHYELSWYHSNSGMSHLLWVNQEWTKAGH